MAIDELAHLSGESFDELDSDPLMQLNIYKNLVEDLNKKLEIKSREEEQLKIIINALEKEVQKKTNELVKSERMLAIAELASRMAHDIKNPLSIIKNTFEMIAIQLNEKKDSPISEQIEMIDRAIKRISHQIDYVLLYVRKSPLEKDSHSVLKIIKSVVSLLEIPERIEVIFPENDSTIFCDENKLEIVFENIISNAIHEIEEKGRILIKIDESKNDVLIRFQDSGNGVSEENLPKVFDALFTTKQNGTGLGLTGCKNIIEMHGGSIWMTINPTTIHIKIPKQQ
jgi:signal transduction histidine kinase